MSSKKIPCEVFQHANICTHKTKKHLPRSVNPLTKNPIHPIITAMDLYSEIILDYYKNPRNKEELADADISTEELNPLCGDDVTIHLKFNENNKVEKATFHGQGCAISQAATSMLTEKLRGLSTSQIKALTNDDIYDMLGIQISPGRVKCALLGLVCAKKAAILHENS